jgi:proteasome assembly chaperone (PAC2) family protein
VVEESIIRTENDLQLRRPILICGWSGWNDAGMAASDSVAFMRTRLKFQKIAEIDPDLFYDFTQVRPTVHLSNGERILKWPSNEISGQRFEDGQHDLMLLHGIEPHLAWQTYVESILAVCREYEVSGVVLLGALLSDVSHRTESTVNGSSTDSDLATLLEIEPRTRGSYEGPTGIVGVMSEALRDAGIPSASLWANAPYYLGSGKNPRCQLALLKRINSTFNLEMSLHDMESRITRWEARIEGELNKDPDLAALADKIGNPETDASDAVDVLPDSDEIVDEIENFFREQQDEDPA